MREPIRGPYFAGPCLVLLLCASPVCAEGDDDPERASRMEQAAVQALDRLLEKLEGASPFDAVSWIENFLVQYKATKIVQDEALQRTKIEASGTTRAQQYGATLSEILEGFKRERAAICPECKGNKTMRCATCKGTGGIPCGKCQSTGKVPCPYCSGSKTERCGKCYGEGTVKEKVPRFGAPGEYDYQDATCPTCKGRKTQACKRCAGKGKSDCGYCGGTGFQTAYYQTCRDCGGTKLIACKKCGGSGLSGKAGAGPAPSQPATGGAPPAGGPSVRAPGTIEELTALMERMRKGEVLAGQSVDLFSQLEAIHDAYEAKLFTAEEYLRRAQGQFR